VTDTTFSAPGDPMDHHCEAGQDASTRFAYSW